jgi:hypothetical protein
VWRCLSSTTASMPRQYSDKHVLPANPSWVEFPRSDGNENNWPQNTTRVVDNEGQVNFMRPVPLDEAGPSMKWRTDIASSLARALNWAGMFCISNHSSIRLMQPSAGPSYVLKDWPKGYRMFDHHKGPQDNPRHDLYLMGEHAFFRLVAFSAYSLFFRLVISLSFCPRVRAARFMAHE